MQTDLRGIPETMLIPLWAKAVETGRPDPIVRDERAVELLSRIDYDFGKFSKVWLSQVGIAVRTELLDRLTREFLSRQPGAVVVNLGAGLDTRFERLQSENFHCWCDLDVPEAIALRRGFFEEGPRNRCIAKSIFDYSWFDDVGGDGRPVLMIAEGLLMYFEESELRPLFDRLADRFPGAEILFEMLAPFLVGQSRRHDALNKMGEHVEFKWGLKDGRLLEGWNQAIRFLAEYHYCDFHKDRWKWFGLLVRMPWLRPRLAHRIVHLRFL